MSDQFYLELRKEVTDVLEEFGTTYTVVIPGSYNETTLKNSSSSEKTVKGLMTDSSFLKQYDHSIETTASKVLLLDYAVDLLPSYSVTVDGLIHPLSSLKELKPGNIRLLYFVELLK